MSAAVLPTPRLAAVSDEDGAVRVELSGAWNLAALQRTLPELKLALGRYAADPRVHWDLRKVTLLDNTGAVVLWRAWGRKVHDHLLLKPEHEPLFRSLRITEEAETPVHRWTPGRALRDLGQQALFYVGHIVGVVVLLGRIVLDLVYVVRDPQRIPWREISANVYRTGAEALGITALVAFLIGVTLAYLSANQLKMFGADVFILNILGIAIVRELGPMLAAILVAGRSGSAMTAQLGVMRVTEELDAMAVMGIPYTIRLVLPKIIALAITMPLLTLWTNAIALVGGMICAQIELGISFQYFVSTLPHAVPVENLFIGIGKAVVFGMLIALVACHFGLRIEPNTESLGAGTTRSVVTSITVVILVDAVFAITFKDMGLQIS